MMNYEWPGNVRELKNCLERMMSFNSGPLLHFDDLPTSIAFHTRARRTGFVNAATVAGGVAGSLPATARIAPVPEPMFPQQNVIPLQELERRAISHALQHTKGDRTMAAQLLGIGRTTLYRKLKDYQIE